MRRGQVIYTYFHFAASEELTRAVIDSGAVAVAYETVQLPSGELPLLTPMSEVAGRMSVQEGAKYLEKVFGGSGILLGGVPGVAPGEVVIIGGGVVGINAAKMAAGLGRARHHPGHLARPAALPRRRAPGQRGYRLLQPAQHPGRHPPGRPGDRRGAPPGRQGPPPGQAGRPQGDEARVGHRGRGGGPGGLRGDHQADHPRESHLLRGWHPALRRGEYAGRGPPDLHPRVDQCHAPIWT